MLVLVPTFRTERPTDSRVWTATFGIAVLALVAVAPVASKKVSGTLDCEVSFPGLDYIHQQQMIHREGFTTNDVTLHVGIFAVLFMFCISNHFTKVTGLAPKYCLVKSYLDGHF